MKEMLNVAWHKWGEGLSVAFIVGALGQIVETLQAHVPGTPIDWHSLSATAWTTGLIAGYAWIKVQLPQWNGQERRADPALPTAPPKKD